MDKILSATCLIILSYAAVLPQQRASTTESDAASLIRAERSFARSSTEIGVRQAFLNFFAPDGVNFQPAPVVVSQDFRTAPDSKEPPKTILHWEPAYADVALSGDLGYTTGPLKVMENTAERKVLRGGFYFSVWKKQADGAWKVLLDMGVGTPVSDWQEGGEPSVSPRFKLRAKGKGADRETLSAEIHRLEQKFCELSAEDAARAYGKFARDDARLHRFGILPVLGKQNVLRHVAEKEPRSKWETIKSGVSEAGDFAWSYGTYKILQETSAEDETKQGYYLRVWRVDGKDNWAMVAEVINPLKLR